MPCSIYRRQAEKCADKATNARRPQERYKYIREERFWRYVADRADEMDQAERIWRLTIKLGDEPSQK
jgi:hypothetical protein